MSSNVWQDCVIGTPVYVAEGLLPDNMAANPGDGVLRLFDALRQEILDALARGERVAETGGDAGASARSHLLAARRAVDLSRLDLVVVGGEGQGKSTLINAILGVAVSPEESAQPGTVAPVFISQGTSDTPAYSVQLADAEAPLAVDEAAFRRYLLQAENRDNAEGVRAGYVQIRHGLLRHGLRIVDMPGVEGLSSQIAEDARAFVRANANVVLGVVRRAGGYGPMSRILRTMLPQGAGPEALVFNSDLMDWNRGPTTAKDEPVLRAYVEEQRKVVADQLRDSWPALAADPQRVFVLHLPSFQARQNGDRDHEWVRNPVHEAEAERFLARLWEHVRVHGVSEVIGVATQKAEAAVRELKAWLDLRRRLLAALAGSDGGEPLALRHDYVLAQADALGQWHRATHEAVLGRRASETWRLLSPSLIETREALVDAIRRVRHQADREAGGVLSDSLARSTKADLDRAAIAANERIESVQRAALQAVLSDLLGDANRILDGLNARLPIVRETIGDLSFDAESIVRLRMGDIDATTLERLMHTAGIAGSAAIGGAAAGGVKTALLLAVAPVLGPVAALAAGAAVTGAVAHTIIKRLRDPNRRGLLRELEALEQSVGTIDTSEHGSLRSAWGTLVRALATDVGRLLEARLASIAAVLDDPGGNRERLEGERAEVEALWREVNSLERSLDGIVERATLPALTPGPD